MRIYDDFRNLVDVAEVAALLLDRSGRILRWTPRALAILGAIPSDRGGPLFDTATETTNDDLLANVGRIGEGLDRVDREVTTRDGRQYLLRIRPYVTADDRIDGVVMVFVDRAEAARETVDSVRALLTRLFNAQEEERLRISRDLHDQLGQEITAARLTLESAMAGPKSAERLLASLQTSLERITRFDAVLESIIWELRPFPREASNLRAALASFVEEWVTKTGIPAEFRCVGPEIGRLDAAVEANIYRIAQEALTNVRKHANATHAGVILERRARAVVLIVEDNGKGLQPGAVERHRGSFGIVGMRERATLIGGRLDIESIAGQGTTVFLQLPVPEGAPAWGTPEPLR